MAQKINWKLLWKEGSTLFVHTLLAGFYLKVAQIIFDYYKAPFLATLLLIMSLGFVIPLLINFVDLWSRLVGAVREEPFAEGMLKASIAAHNKLFGSKNAFMAEKKAILGSLYLNTGKTVEGEQSFKEAWEIFCKSKPQFPWLHSCYEDYLKILDTSGDTTTAAQIRAKLKTSKLYHAVQKAGIVLITLPLLGIMVYKQIAEQAIEKNNAHGKVILALKEIESLAHYETMVFGQYGAARVYYEYARAFDDSDGQNTEADWSALRALNALKDSGRNDDLLKVAMLNIVARGEAAEGKEDKALLHMNEAVHISLNWKEEPFNRYNLRATLERDKAILALAELNRSRGRYEQAEVLYKKVLDVTGSQVEFQKVQKSLLDPVEIVDRLHKLQSIELKLGNKDETLKIQDVICKVLNHSIEQLSAAHGKNGPIWDFGVREATREMDVYALMLQNVGRDAEAKKYRQQVEALRDTHNKALKLNPVQQDSIVTTATKVTNDLLAVKYKTSDWHESLNDLLSNQLKSKSAQVSFERLPWYDGKRGKLKADDKDSAAADRTLHVDISSLSIRSDRESEGVAAEVQGVVKIRNAKSKIEDEEKFGFAYVLRDQKSGHPWVDDVLDSHALAQAQFD